LAFIVRRLVDLVNLANRVYVPNYIALIVKSWSHENRIWQATGCTVERFPNSRALIKPEQELHESN
jgi:hypothetical protein